MSSADLTAETRITILWLDDDPESARGVSDNEVRLENSFGDNSPLGQSAAKESFNLIWLQTVEEMKQYFNAIQQARNYDPKDLITAGVLPEIILFDYNLDATPKFKRTGSEYDASVNPLELIRSRLDYGPSYLGSDSLFDSEGHDFNAEEKNQFGLFIGSLFISLFGDYITVGIPTTAQPDRGQSGGSAGMIEWFQNEQMGFTTKKRDEIQWGPLLFSVLPKLRERLSSLIEIGTLKLTPISAKMLLEFTQRNYSAPLNFNDLKQHQLQITHPAYGQIDLKLTSLYFDLFCTEGGTALEPFRFTASVKPENFLTAVKALCQQVVDLNSPYIKYLDYARDYHARNLGKDAEESYFPRRLRKHTKGLYAVAAICILIELSEDEFSSWGELKAEFLQTFLSDASNENQRKIVSELQLNAVNTDDGSSAELFEEQALLLQGQQLILSNWPAWLYGGR